MGKKFSSRPPSRKVTKLNLKRTILAIVEGEKTEKQYLQSWYKTHRENIALTIIDSMGGPREQVDEAMKVCKREKAKARTGGGREYDEIWCVFDVDEHPELQDSINDANQCNINIAVSNPCIELWFVLHFRDQTAEVDRHVIQSNSKDLLGCDKSLSPSAIDALTARFNEARERAIALNTRHLGNDTPFPANPSSGLWKLVDSICRA